MDWEAEIAIANLEMDGKPAVYETAEGVQTPLTVLFTDGTKSVAFNGQKVNSIGPVAMGARSALRDVTKGSFLIINGSKYLIGSMPEDDSRVWITLTLEGPTTDDD